MTNYDQKHWATQKGDDYWKAYQRQELQENSLALVRAIEKQCEVDTVQTCHEMGANLGRNLAFINGRGWDWLLTANDINLNAPLEAMKAYPDVTIKPYHVMPSEEWCEYMADNERTVDMVISSDHFIHIEDLSPFVRHLPQIVGRYFVARESAGIASPEYRHRWTVWRQERGLSRWFDHDVADWFDGSGLKLIHRQRQRAYDENRAYDIYIFEVEGE